MSKEAVNGEIIEMGKIGKASKDAEKNTKMSLINKKSGWLMGCGSVAVVLGGIAAIFWPAVFFSQLKRMMILTNTSTSFGIWREIPIPMYLECFMWNITNVDELLDPSKRNVTIKVEQLGPYVYREQHTKVDIEFNDNATVTFYNERFWYFEPEMSNGSLSDVVTSINPVVATIAYIMRNQPTFLRVSADVMMKMYHEHMFTKANVSSWLFDGIDDPLLSAVNKLPIKLPIEIPFDKFGWFYDRNGTKEFDGVFVMNTGAQDFSRLGDVEMWNYSNRTIYRDECGAVRGSTGELWAPELGQPEVTVFAPDICTYIILKKNKSIEYDGIEGVEYNAGTTIFDNGYHEPRTACYCAEVRDRDCLPSGALNVSACRYGAPAFVSLPHFLHSDPYYPSKIEGLQPTEDYNFRLALEMFTGIPLRVAAQLQINLLVRYVHGISLINVLPEDDVLVPMFWFRQEVKITPEYARLARFALNIRYKTPYAFYAITALGLSLLLGGIIVLIKRLLRSPDTAPILQDESNDTQ